MPEADDPPDLLLGLGLATHVVELHAPVRVARLEAADLGDAHREHRPEQDHEVEDEEDDERDYRVRSDPGTRAIPALIVCEASPTVPKKLVSSSAVITIIRTKYTARIASTIRYSDLEPEVPEPDAPTRDDVLLAQRRAVDPEQARPADEAVEDQVEDAPEGGDGEEREQQRPADRPALDLVRPDEDRRRGENSDPGRGSAQRAPLRGQRALIVRGEQPSCSRAGAHRCSVDVTKLTYFDVNASDLFAAEEIERARAYHRPLYRALGVDLALELGVLLAITFSVVGDWLWDLTGGPWWAETLELAALVALVGALVRLPLSCWRGWVYERRWGFSTQTLRSWLSDRAKGLVLGALLTGLALVLLLGAIRAWPSAWPLVAAPGAAVLTLVLSVLAPPLFERLFNRFWPLPDPELAKELQELSVRAGVPVRTMLVADASRRTRKHNAYVSGLGPTRRLVLYDTLLEDVPRGELRGVVAHELGHRRFRHVAVGTALGMLGAAAAVVILWLVLSWQGLLDAAGASGPGDPRVVPLVLLVLYVLELGALPFETWLSRRWERAADRFAVDLTGDGNAIEEMHRRLALANLADLDPPPLLYKLLFTHPTPPERIAAARARMAR